MPSKENKYNLYPSQWGSKFVSNTEGVLQLWQNNSSHFRIAQWLSFFPFALSKAPISQWLRWTSPWCKAVRSRTVRPSTTGLVLTWCTTREKAENIYLKAILFFFFNLHDIMPTLFAQLLSHVPLCNPMNCSMPGFPVLLYFLDFAQTHILWVGDAIQPSHPLLSPSPPALNLSHHQSLSQWVLAIMTSDCSWKRKE